VTAAAGVPAGVGVEPAVDVERLEVADGQAAVAVAEVLQERPVPGERVGLVVPPRVVEEEVADGSDEEGGWLGDLTDVPGEEAAEGPVGLLLVLAALDELDLLPLLADPDLSVPPPVELAEERLSRHDNPPVLVTTETQR
jgi:hypothetical protein